MREDAAQDDSEDAQDDSEDAQDEMEMFGCCLIYDDPLRFHIHVLARTPEAKRFVACKELMQAVLLCEGTEKGLERENQALSTAMGGGIAQFADHLRNEYALAAVSCFRNIQDPHNMNTETQAFYSAVEAMFTERLNSRESLQRAEQLNRHGQLGEDGIKDIVDRFAVPRVVFEHVIRQKWPREQLICSYYLYRMYEQYQMPERQGQEGVLESVGTYDERVEMTEARNLARDELNEVRNAARLRQNVRDAAKNGRALDLQVLDGMWEDQNANLAAHREQSTDEWKRKHAEKWLQTSEVARELAKKAEAHWRTVVDRSREEVFAWQNCGVDPARGKVAIIRAHQQAQRDSNRYEGCLRDAVTRRFKAEQSYNDAKKLFAS